ncbi:Geraniol 8-hydroxylase [Spatholobus suberectus]|nr:Geraniol 8-hydroxylase [Spatholobus suberectus]
MDFVSCVVLLVLASTTIHVVGSFLGRRSRKPNYKLPPGPSPLPIIGNLLELGNKPHQSLAKLAKIHGPLMSLKLGQITTVVVSSAEMAKEVLLTHDHLLSNRTIPQSVSVLNHENYSLAFIPVSTLWRDLRKICNGQLFARNTLDASQDVRRKKVQQLLAEIHQSCQIGEAVDIGTAVFKTTINLLSNTIFSVDLIQSAGTAGEFKDLVTNITKLVGTPNLADYFPILKTLDPQGIKRRQTKNVEKVLDIFDGLVEQRLKQREGTDVDYVHKDMLDALLNISRENEMMDKTMIQHLSHSHFTSSPPHSLRLTHTASPLFKPRPLSSIGISPLPERRRTPVAAAVEESQESSEPEPEPEPEVEAGSKAELASELKKAMAERKEKEEENLLSGVAREIDEIEWPAFGKVLGTTGVVVSVILGSSVVLLTVNAVLAELSDRVFAGKGIQDFFT